MPMYRLHFLNAVGEHVMHSYPFPAETDADALAFAEVWKEDAPMELWAEDARLRRWNRPRQP